MTLQTEQLDRGAGVEDVGHRSTLAHQGSPLWRKVERRFGQLTRVGSCHHRGFVLFFDLDTFWLAVAVVVIVVGSAVAGIAAGRRLRDRPDSSSEPVGVVQAALLGLVGLLLAFGLTMAVGRYETRRALIVQESNAIGTTYLRAQLLPEPMRSGRLTC